MCVCGKGEEGEGINKHHYEDTIPIWIEDEHLGNRQGANGSDEDLEED